MTRNNAENERVKRRYLHFLKDAKGRDEASLDAVAKAIERFEEYNGRRDFKKFHVEQARAFKTHLMAVQNARTGAPLSASTVHSTLGQLKAFFGWLAQQSGYRSRIKFADAEYFNPPGNLSRIATARRHKVPPTLNQVRAMLTAMPSGSEIERRDQALIAFAILSGARDRAVISFKLKHIDLEASLIQQDARQVRTKQAKTFQTWFFPVGKDIREIFSRWVGFLREEKGFGPEDPLFPKSKVEPGPNMEFRAVGLDRAHWANAGPVRRIFREACQQAGLRYSNPHLFRDTLVQLAYALRLDAEKFKAWSQNIGHESVLTTFSAYGEIQPARQAEIMRNLARNDPHIHESQIGPDILRKLADQIERAHQ
jgi:integrase/recombinase XerD